MLDLLAAVRPADRIAAYPSIVDLHELLALSQVRTNTRLWVDATDRLVAFALVDQDRNLLFEVDRHAAPPSIDAKIVAWGVTCVRRAMQESGEPLTLDASCRDDDTERMALLEGNGFVIQASRSLRMARSLTEPVPEPQLPPGFRLRHVAGEQEVEEATALVELHRAAFGTANMTVEERLAMMRVPDYDPELDLLVVAPDGRMAAYCMASISREENELSGRKDGYTDPVATHPDFRRRGLARALLLTAMQELSRRGMETALLGTSSENIAMQRAAQAVGFHTVSTSVWYAKQVSQEAAAG